MIPVPIPACTGMQAGTRIVVATRPVDFRRGMDGLATLVQQQLQADLVEALRAYLEEQLARIPGKSGLAGAIRYLFNHWDGLIRFLDDGRLELDTNTVERSIRPIKLGAKNCLFAGSDGGAETWAIIASLIQTAKLNGVEPFAWLKDGLERVVSGQTKATDLHTLLPWAWKPATAA